MSNLICAWHGRYFPGEPAVIRAVEENFGGDTHGICPHCYERLCGEIEKMLISAELEARFVADCTAWYQAGHTRTACNARLAVYQALLKLHSGDWLSRNTDAIKDRLDRLEREADWTGPPTGSRLMGSSKWPVMAGCALGFGLAVQFWPGGYDGLEFYMKAPMPNTTAPAWVYLLTWPLSWLGWPLSWQVLTAVTVLIVALVAMRSGARYWWAPLISLPLLWNVWLAQIEVLPVAGALLGMLVSRRKLHPAWLGVAWLLLAVKPQVGAGLALLFAWWIWRERGLRSLWPACCIVVAVVAVTILLWPAWIGNWLSVMRAFRATWWSASVWPYGLLAWPLALMPGKISQERRMRMVAAATLLGSPYFALYHATTLVALAASPLLAVASWLPLVVGGVLGVDGWMQWGWWLPALSLARDVIAPDERIMT